MVRVIYCGGKNEPYVTYESVVLLSLYSKEVNARTVFTASLLSVARRKKQLVHELEKYIKPRHRSVFKKEENFENNMQSKIR